jgi:hypothetical protein
MNDLNLITSKELYMKDILEYAITKTFYLNHYRYKQMSKKTNFNGKLSDLEHRFFETSFRRQANKELITYCNKNKISRFSAFRTFIIYMNEFLDIHLPLFKNIELIVFKSGYLLSEENYTIESFFNNISNVRKKELLKSTFIQK